LPDSEIFKGPGKVALKEGGDPGGKRRPPTGNNATGVEGPDGGSKLMLGLQDALHELATLKVLNPNIATEGLLSQPKGDGAYNNESMTTSTMYTEKGERERKKKALSKRSRRERALAKKMEEEDTYASNEKESASVQSIQTIETEKPEKHPGLGFAPGTLTTTQAYIKERGRLVEYSSERAKKKKVMNVTAPTVHCKLPENSRKTDRGPAATTPWRDLPKEPVDLAHMVVSGTGSPFIMPTDVPKPHRPRSPRKMRHQRQSVLLVN
jgi:hypothetical protein